MLGEMKEVDEHNKTELYRYVDEYVEDDILKTFNKLWDERNYWKYKPLMYIIDNKIVGFAAYTINEKYPGKLKVYYLHTRSDFRGQKIAKQLLRKMADIAIENNVDMLYITEENTDGSKLFKDLDYTTKKNEFNTIDYIYNIPKNKLINMFL